MKRYGNLFSAMLEWQNLLSATKNAAHGKRKYQPQIAQFLFRQEIELLGLKQELTTHTYLPGEYHQFTIFDPKKRLINVAPFRDRVVHHALCDLIGPILDQTLIPTSFACRLGKGMHRALQLAQIWAKKYPYFLKLDISKYFDSISHQRLQQALERKIKDADILWLIAVILEKVPPNYQQGYGLPIGNLTSQHFANYYLGSLDHYIKQELKIPAYMRYMDDLLLCAPDKLFLNNALQEIHWFAQDRLELRLKPSATILAPVKKGIPFLGFRLFPGYTWIQKKNWRRFKRNMLDKQKQYLSGKIAMASLQMSVATMINHLSYGNTYHLRKIFLDKYSIEV